MSKRADFLFDVTATLIPRSGGTPPNLYGDYATEWIDAQSVDRIRAICRFTGPFAPSYYIEESMDKVNGFGRKDLTEGEYTITCRYIRLSVSGQIANVNTSGDVTFQAVARVVA